MHFSKPLVRVERWPHRHWESVPVSAMALLKPLLPCEGKGEAAFPKERSAQARADVRLECPGPFTPFHGHFRHFVSIFPLIQVIHQRGTANSA